MTDSTTSTGGGAPREPSEEEMRAALAGDHFNHVLSVVPPFESCARIRARARAGWVVVTDPSYGYGFLSVDPYAGPRCFARRSPTYDDGTFRVYSSR